MSMYRCRMGCFSDDPNFRCAHGGATGKALEPTFDVDETVVRTLVEKAIRGAICAPEYHDSPAWRFYRYKRQIIEQSDRRFKRLQTEGYRRLAAKAEYDIQRIDALACCPVLPVVRWL